MGRRYQISKMVEEVEDELVAAQEELEKLSSVLGEQEKEISELKEKIGYCKNCEALLDLKQ